MKERKNYCRKCHQVFGRFVMPASWTDNICKVCQRDEDHADAQAAKERQAGVDRLREGVPK